MTMKNSSGPWEFHCLNQQRRVISEVRIPIWWREFMWFVAFGVVSTLRSFPFLCKTITFKHAYNFRHSRPVPRKILCAQECHLNNFLKLNPVIVVHQILVHKQLKLLLLMDFPYLRVNVSILYIRTSVCLFNYCFKAIK